MNGAAAAAAALILSLGAPAHSHRLDEYLQAAVISLERNRVQVELRLTPGVAILPVFLAATDRDSDGVIFGIRAEGLCRTRASRDIADL